MFKTLAKSRFLNFWPVQPRRIAPLLHEVRLSNATYCNDNLPGFRRPAAARKRRSPTPALACHWINRNGRLECRWQAEPGDDTPIGDFDEHGATGSPSHLSSIHPRGHRLTLAG